MRGIDKRRYPGGSSLNNNASYVTEDTLDESTGFRHSCAASGVSASFANDQEREEESCAS